MSFQIDQPFNTADWGGTITFHNGGSPIDMSAVTDIWIGLADTGRGGTVLSGSYRTGEIVATDIVKGFFTFRFPYQRMAVLSGRQYEFAGLYEMNGGRHQLFKTRINANEGLIHVG